MSREPCYHPSHLKGDLKRQPILHSTHPPISASRTLQATAIRRAWEAINFSTPQKSEENIMDVACFLQGNRASLFYFQTASDV